MDIEKRLDGTEELGARIVDMFNESGLDIEAQVVVLFDLLLSTLSSIKCGECRRLQAEQMKELLPDMISVAMSQPTVREHIH